MKYVSLDLETMGVHDRNPDRILMISMVIDDTKNPDVPVDELPSFTAIIRQPKIIGEPCACAMNAWLFVAIEYSETKMTEEKFYIKYTDLGIPQETVGKGITAGKTHKVLDMVVMEFLANKWLTEHFGTKDKITIAGKNAAGFDMTFLPPDLRERFRHSVIDPGSIFWNPDHDRMLPHSAEVMKRASVKYEGAHDALEDAKMVIKAIRNSPFYWLKQARTALSRCAVDHPEAMAAAQKFLLSMPDYLKGVKNENN